VLRARNGIKHVAGIDRAKVGQSPKDLIFQKDKVTLYRYRSDKRQYRTPVFLVMSLVSKSYIFDLRPGSSFVEVMLGRGLDVFLLDWGIPDELEAGNTLETYCDRYLPMFTQAAVDEAGAEDLTVFGYCMGGMLAALFVAGHPEAPVKNLCVMAAPIDSSKMGPMSNLSQEGRIEVDDMIDETGNVPAEAILSSFKMLKPTQDIVGYANLWQNMWDDQYMVAYQTMNGWGKDQIPFPGATMRQMVQLINRDNALMNDTMRLGGRRVSLSDVKVPFLSVLAENDHIAPPESVSPFVDLIGSEDKTEMRLKAGHVGIMVGRNASKNTMPAMAEWIAQHSEPIPGTQAATEDHSHAAEQVAATLGAAGSAGGA
jgi:polyhydroxyalkanoate synthase